MARAQRYRAESAPHMDWQQTHIDLGALDQRVTGTEKAIENLSSQISNMVDSFSSQMRDLSTKLDSQQTTYANSRGTNWYAFITAAAGVCAVLGGFGMAIKQPIDLAIERHEAGINRLIDRTVNKEEYNTFVRTAGEWSASLRDRLRADEDGAVSQRQLSEMKQRLDEHDQITAAALGVRITRLEQRFEESETQAIKRPEMSARIDALGNRIDIVSTRIAELYRSLLGAFMAKTAPAP